MKARATARYVRQSPRKMRLMADLIRGKSVGEAYAILQHSKKRAARMVDKTLRSAVANAVDRASTDGVSLDIDDLVVAEAFVNEGPRLRRWRAAAMGRAAPRRRPLAHVTVVVNGGE